MKRKSIIALLIGVFSFGMLSTSCDDMLSPSSERHSYVVAQDTLYSYWGIIKSLQNIAERYVVLGECRGDLISGTTYVSDTIKAILDYDMDLATDGSCRFLQASDYYHVINSCNAYLASCDTARVTGTLEPYMLKEAAQVTAIRAWVYLQLVQVYGEVPFYTEPLLTTDAIDAFMANHPKANAQNLADLLAPDLVKAQQIEMKYGYPQYQEYKGAQSIHSSKCMIPCNVILGDLYLTKGDAASCELAAQYYYDYFSGNQGMSLIPAGGTLPAGYESFGKKYEGETDVTYTNLFSNSSPWTEFGQQTPSKEAVTAIPSTTNKLWGNVLRGVNELFGFESEISVYTSGGQDTVTNATVFLTPKYDAKQLYASKGYFQQALAQNFETYIATDITNINAATPPVIDPNVGDARQYWAKYESRQTYDNGVINLERFISKQNPRGSFTSIYPMIYRKSQLWLRFAEALNRAGYPSYAFAILRNGLCNNTMYYPVPETEDYAKDYAFHYAFTRTLPDNTTYRDTIPAASDMSILSLADLTAAVQADLGADYELQKKGIDSVCISYNNYPNDATNKVLYYLDARETKRNPRFLNFGFEELDGQYASQYVVFSPALSSTQMTMSSVTIASTADSPKGTIGIHSRGCGMLYPETRMGDYDYVGKVIEKAALYGQTITKEDIYSGAYDQLVQDCVEDLIIDEAAMELAFEGNRFFDLMRVAMRRGTPEYLAQRVAMRDGTMDSGLYTKLLNQKNWFFPLPRH